MPLKSSGVGGAIAQSVYLIHNLVIFIITPEPFKVSMEIITIFLYTQTYIHKHKHTTHKHTNIHKHTGLIVGPFPKGKNKLRINWLNKNKNIIGYITRHKSYITSYIIHVAKL